MSQPKSEKYNNPELKKILSTSTTKVQKENEILSPQKSKKTIITHKLKSELLTTKQKVLIFSNEQGNGLALTLQTLLGNSFQVQNICKPGAKMQDILKPMKSMENMSKRDYVIIIGGSNDNDPYLLLSHLNFHLHCLSQTNTIVCQPSYNRYLNINKLRYEINFLCKKFEDAVYLDLRYDLYTPRRENNRMYMSQHLLQEILRIDYRNNYNGYTQKRASDLNKSIITKNSSTQTHAQCPSDNTSAAIRLSQEAVEHTSNNGENDHIFLETLY